MSVQARSAFPAIGILAFSLSLSILPPNGAASAADSCLTAPNSPAPQGSHWYYRTERPSLRKCWRLVQKDRSEASAAAQTAPRPEPDTAAKAPSAPVADSSAGRMEAPQAEPAQAPFIRNLVTRNVSNALDTAQPLPLPEPPASATPSAETPSAPEAPVQTIRNEPVLAATVQPPVPAADATANAADADGTPTLRLLLGALALLGFLACAVFFIMEMVRRRTDVLSTVRDVNTVPFEEPPKALPSEELPVVDAPTFAPLPPIGLTPREDDVDVALRRFRQNARRRAA